MLNIFCVNISAQNELTLSHGLIEKGQVVKLSERQTRTMYLDLQNVTNGYDALLEHAKLILKHLRGDLAHLRTSSSNSIKVSSTGESYFFLKSVTGEMLEDMCAIAGGKAATLADKDAYAAVADVIAEHNAATQNTAVITPDKIIVAVLANTAGELVYVGSGEKLTLPSDIATTANLLIAKTVSPLYNINKKGFEFRNEDKPAVLMCEHSTNSSIAIRSLYKTFTLLREKWLEGLQEEIENGKTTWESTFPETKIPDDVILDGNPVMELHGDEDLTSLRDTIVKNPVLTIHSETKFTLVTALIDKCIDYIRRKLTGLQAMVLQTGHLTTRIQESAMEALKFTLNKGTSDEEKVALHTVLMATVQYGNCQYDKLKKGVSMGITYKNPLFDQSYRLLHVLPIPVKLQGIEVLMDLSEDHILQKGADNCEFCNYDTTRDNCVELNTQPFIFACDPEQLPNKIDTCCNNTVNLDPKQTLLTCNTTNEVKPPTMQEFAWERYNVLLTASERVPQKIETTCLDNNTVVVTEPSMMYAPCDVTFLGSKVTYNGVETGVVEVTTLSNLFQQVLKLITESDITTIIAKSKSKTTIKSEINKLWDSIGTGWNITIIVFAVAIGVCVIAYGILCCIGERGRHVRGQGYQERIMAHQLSPLWLTSDRPTNPSTPNSQFI